MAIILRPTVFLRKSQELISPCPYTQSPQQCKERNSCPLSKQYKRWFYRLVSQISKQHKVTNQSPNQHLMQPSEGRSTAIGFVQVGQSCQSCKYTIFFQLIIFLSMNFRHAFFLVFFFRSKKKHEFSMKMKCSIEL